VVPFLLTHWDNDITVDTADNNIPTLATSSPAIGAGTTSPTLFTAFSGGARVGSSLAPNIDMGAYPTDNSRNKHLPTRYGYVSTNVNTLSGNHGFSVYPNPVIDEINITCPSANRGSMQVDFIDMEGKVVLSKTIVAANQSTINISNLTKGLYICRLVQGSIVETKKIIKD
jgi:hypothetical protein